MKSRLYILFAAIFISCCTAGLSTKNPVASTYVGYVHLTVTFPFTGYCTDLHRSTKLRNWYKSLWAWETTTRQSANVHVDHGYAMVAFGLLYLPHSYRTNGGRPLWWLGGDGVSCQRYSAKGGLVDVSYHACTPTTLKEYIHQ